MNIGIVVGMFHKDVAEEMISTANARAIELGAQIKKTFRIPGSMDAVLPVKWLMHDPEINAVVVLGAIEKGETLHGQVMGHEVTNKLLQLSIDHDKPLGYGIIGPGATLEQIKTRGIGHAQAAVNAALELYNLQLQVKKETR